MVAVSPVLILEHPGPLTWGDGAVTEQQSQCNWWTQDWPAPTWQDALALSYLVRVAGARNDTAAKSPLAFHNEQHVNVVLPIGGTFCFY